MPKSTTAFKTVEAAIKALPDAFWFYVGGSKNDGWERMTRDELMDMAVDDDEMDREEGIRTTLDQAATFLWIDAENGRIATDDDPVLYEFSTAQKPVLPNDDI